MNINSNAKVYLQLKKVVISPPRSGAKISASPAIMATQYMCVCTATSVIIG